MTNYEYTVKAVHYGTKTVLVLKGDDGSGDEPSELVFYEEDLDKVIEALKAYKE